MNYEPSTVLWEPGDLVLHDADAKEPRMLMRVLRYGRDGRCVTVYHTGGVDGKCRRQWKNRPAVLHDPARFGIAVAGAARAGEGE